MQKVSYSTHGRLRICTFWFKLITYFYPILNVSVICQTKKQNPTDESIHSEVVGQACVEKYALKIFEKADDDDRQSRFNK